jgi:flavorubredoxin
MSGIYAITHPHGYVKIGNSDRPRRRFEDIQIGSPYTLRLYLVLTVHENAEELEREVHKALDEKRKRGEWFQMNKADVREVFETIVNTNSNAVHLKTPNYGKRQDDKTQTTFSEITTVKND